MTTTADALNARARGIYLELIDLDDTFHKLESLPVLVNDYNLTDKEDKERLNKILMMFFDGDSLDPVASCDCGHLRGDYLEGVCPICHSMVLPITERSLDSKIWMRVPEGVPAFINPHVWIMLGEAMNTKVFNMLEYLTCPGYTTPVTGRNQAQPHKKLKVDQLGIPRDISYFIENFDDIMALLREHRLLKDNTPDGPFATFLALNRERLFTRYLPVPSQLNFIVENTAIGRYADTDMNNVKDALQTINSLEHPVTPITRVKTVNGVVKIQRLMGEYYLNFYGGQLGGKPGWFRKHVYGGSLHYSFRAVITSISEVHDKEECHLPWSLACLLLKTHLSSLLLAKGFTPNEIEQFIYSNTLQHNPLMEELFQALVQTSIGVTHRTGQRGIPIILQRNPTLKRGSAQRLIVTKIKPDPRDNTIGLSVQVLAAPNADQQYYNEGFEHETFLNGISEKPRFLHNSLLH